MESWLMHLESQKIIDDFILKTVWSGVTSKGKSGSDIISYNVFKEYNHPKMKAKIYALMGACWDQASKVKAEQLLKAFEKKLRQENPKIAINKFNEKMEKYWWYSKEFNAMRQKLNMLEERETRVVNKVAKKNHVYSDSYDENASENQSDFGDDDDYENYSEVSAEDLTEFETVNLSDLVHVCVIGVEPNGKRYLYDNACRMKRVEVKSIADIFIKMGIVCQIVAFGLNVKSKDQLNAKLKDK